MLFGSLLVWFLSTEIWKEWNADIWKFPTLEIARYSSEPTYTASDSVSLPFCSLWQVSSANFFIVFVMTSFCRRQEQWCGRMFSSIFVHVMGFCSSPAWCSVFGFNSELYMSIALIHLLFWNLLASIELPQGLLPARSVFIDEDRYTNTSVGIKQRQLSLRVAIQMNSTKESLH